MGCWRRNGHEPTLARRMADCHDLLMTEPDYRFSLAAERTYLAYLWSALALLAGALVALGYLDSTHRGASAHGAAFGLFALGFVTLVGGHLRFRGVMASMRAGQPLPTNPLPTMLTTLVLAVALLGVVANQLD